MNDFTKDELLILLKYAEYTDLVYDQERIDITLKLQSMIDNYPPFNTKQIAKSHLEESESLISHAINLLGLRDPDDE